MLNGPGIVSACEAIREGRASSEEVVSSYLSTIAAREAEVQAFAWFDPEFALDQAVTADRVRAIGRPLGPLHGVPIGVKDLIDTRGIPTARGSPVFAGRVPTANAHVVDLLLAAGAVLIGKTVTTEFAWSTPGKTHNPWNTAHTPGGSSSGSAAGVAAGFMAGALGTQTVGSVVRPAAFCGVVGFKPTYGLIGRSGIHPFSATLDHVGVFARSVEDAAWLASVLAGHDAGDSASLMSGALPRGGLRLEPFEAPPRLALARTARWDRCDPAQQEALLHSAERLREAGAEVVDIELPPAFAEGPDRVQTLMRCEAAHVFAPIDDAHPDLVSAAIRSVIQDGRSIPAWDYLSALHMRLQLRESLDGMLADYDGLITVPAIGEAPGSLASTGDPSFCATWSMLGVPAVNLPCSLGPNGLPLGIQMVGRYLDDVRLLRSAQWCERVLGFEKHRPA